ncbi:MAG: helix-turn-helix transcriptional regulator [Clostridium sp.]|nr:helix-turn-helix transcriptional regulator [Clostridium sp.]
MEVNMEFITKLMHNIGEFFGEKCEVVLHDYANGFDHTIVDIVNGEVSGREIGGCPSNTFIEKLQKNPHEIDQHPTYFIQHNKGKIIKSCSTLIRDGKGAVVGSLCINLDVTDFILLQNTVSDFVKYNTSDSMVDEEAVLVKNVDELTSYYMQMAEKEVGKPMSLMNKEEKVKALVYLHAKGFFKISKANVILCEAFQISKYTLYSYLEEGQQKAEKMGWNF